MISIFDEISQYTTEDVHEKMLTAFHTSTKWEWHFWNDAYQQAVFDHRQYNLCDMNAPPETAAEPQFR
jgi:hypothetical protein